MPSGIFVCHLSFFRNWVDGRDHFKNDFKKSRIELGAKSVYGPNREMTQNVGIKSVFMPFFFKNNSGFSFLEENAHNDWEFGNTEL